MQSLQVRVESPRPTRMRTYRCSPPIAPMLGMEPRVLCVRAFCFSKASSLHHAALLHNANNKVAPLCCLCPLQKPKKLTLTGSDGAPYSFLAKPKDDLRKDYRWGDRRGGRQRFKVHM